MVAILRKKSYRNIIICFITMLSNGWVYGFFAGSAIGQLSYHRTARVNATNAVKNILGALFRVCAHLRGFFTFLMH